MRQMDLEFLLCSHEQTPCICCGLLISCCYDSPAEVEPHFRPCSHSDLSARASNRDNCGGDRLILIGSPGQEELGQNPFHASPEDITFHSMNHITWNPTEPLVTSLNTQRADRLLHQLC